MCGFAGFVDARGIDTTQAHHIGETMANAIIHRGPDDSGIWFNCENGVVLAHRRLSVQDLSPHGHQPMVSASERFVLVFNGEVYNHLELRKKLEEDGRSPTWRGHSDTETILALIEAYGLPNTLSQIEGMFAFALWDKCENAVFLARDRIGEKPLYYGKQGNLMFFSSELKSIRKHPEFIPRIKLKSLYLYLQNNYVPSPHSIYEDIYKLEPGHYLKLASGEEPIAYWSLSSIVFNKSEVSIKSDEEYLEQLETELKRSVLQQMQADVPLGAFLSGGVDSSLIVSLMQEQTSKTIKSFSIGFDDVEFDEAPFAKAVANHIGTEHCEFYVTSKQARDVVPKLPNLYDEPFADSSQIPTFLVSEIARQHVTVSLSGDAGDEIFGGYNRYNWGVNIWSKLSCSPASFRKFAKQAIQGISTESWNFAFSPMRKILPTKYRFQNFGDKIHKIAGLLTVVSEEDLYINLTNNWKEPNTLLRTPFEGYQNQSQFLGCVSALSFAERMMAHDTVSYLPDDILVKVDRASMGVSLETRAPFLDHRVVETAWQMPIDMKIRNGIGKYCLRELLYKRVPPALIERPKMGFGVPLNHWLRGPLKEWGENLIDKNRLEESGFFNYEEIHLKWNEHLSGKRNWQHQLWGVLMFEAWRDEVGM